MSSTLTEGSLYKCYIHEFETNNLHSWFQHKLSIIHDDAGTSKCIYCKKDVKFEHLHQISMDHLVPAICPECAPKNQTEANSELVGPKVLSPDVVAYDEIISEDKD